MNTFAMRLQMLTAVLFAIAFAVLPSVGYTNEKPTDYDIELAQIHKDIAELKGRAFTHPIKVEKVTKFIDLLYRQASLTGDPADFTVAKTAIDNASRQIGAWEELYLLKANLNFKFHRLSDTRDDLTMVKDLADSSQVKTLNADLALQEGRYEDAREGYEDVIRKNRTWDNLARLAYLKSKTGDVSGAEKLYLDAQVEITAKEMRSFSWVELQRGLLDFNCGRHEDALAHYRRANRAYSGYWLVEAYIAEVFGAQRKFDNAVALFETVIARTAKPELQQALGDLYVFMGKPNQAKPWHEKALATYLASAQRGEVLYFHHLAGFYADVREDGAEAVKWARRDLELRKNFATHDALAWALYRDGQFINAIDEMNTALSSGVRDAHLFFHAAMIHLAAGRTEEGKQFLRQAAEVNPHVETFHAHH